MSIKTPFPNKTQIIIPFLNSMISSNHEKWDEFLANCYSYTLYYFYVLEFLIYVNLYTTSKFICFPKSWLFINRFIFMSNEKFALKKKTLPQNLKI